MFRIKRYNFSTIANENGWFKAFCYTPTLKTKQKIFLKPFTFDFLGKNVWRGFELIIECNKSLEKYVKDFLVTL